MAHNQENNFYNSPMNVVCPHCGALRFQGEPSNCSQSGKVSLLALQEYLLALRQLYEANTREDGNFRKNVRNYNSAFAFSSFEANFTPPYQEVALIVSDYRAELTIMPATSTTSS